MSKIRVTKNTFTVTKNLLSALNKFNDTHYDTFIKPNNTQTNMYWNCEVFILVSVPRVKNKIRTAFFGLDNFFIQVVVDPFEKDIIHVRGFTDLFVRQFKDYLWLNHMYKIDHELKVPIDGFIGFLRYIEDGDMRTLLPDTKGGINP